VPHAAREYDHRSPSSSLPICAATSPCVSTVGDAALPASKRIVQFRTLLRHGMFSARSVAVALVMDVARGQCESLEDAPLRHLG